jgi:hypothetical protein
MNCLFGLYLFVGQLSCQKMHRNLPSAQINYALGSTSETASITSVSKPNIFYPRRRHDTTVANRFLGMNIVADWIEECDAVCVSVEYRLAPENPHPVPIEDCYAELKWTGESLTELQIDPERLMMSSMSAGGWPAASLALHVRDRGGSATAPSFSCVLCWTAGTRLCRANSTSAKGLGAGRAIFSAEVLR